ncbi:hypothetical protein [Nocardia sp. NPDC046763]|uniref:hypothetical protein n=1 Tax=Nocardia sp. NPDC046763 TaxID=3155256 RepID=UPI0033D92FFE
MASIEVLPARPHRAEGKKHNAALICLARRRCDVLFAMLKTKQPYRGTATA